jgi:hypothetical protein
LEWERQAEEEDNRLARENEAKQAEDAMKVAAATKFCEALDENEIETKIEIDEEMVIDSKE